MHLVQKLHLLVFLAVVLVKAGTSTLAQSVPIELRVLYQAADIDPDNVCLAGALPSSPMEHADRERCLFHSFFEGRGPISALEPQ